MWMRRPIVVVLWLSVVLGGCQNSGPSHSEQGATVTTAATPAAGPCSLGPQAPPPGTIDAGFATALAFAPDGRLFFAERSGTVRVFQDGAVRQFATVPTVTTEAGGRYSERG